MQQQRRIDDGISLVNDNGRCVQVKSVQDGTAICDDSNFRREQKYEIDNLAKAVKDGEMRVVENSKLTAVKGIGEATAPKVEAKTGCQTPSELAHAYLRDSDVREAIPRTDYFVEWLQQNIDVLEIDVSKGHLRVMLFITEVGCNKKASDLQNVGDITTKYTGGIKKEKLELSHVDWENGELWCDAANVMCVAKGLDGLADLQPRETWETMEPCDEHESDGNHHKFVADGGVTWVSGDYVDTLQNVFDVSLDDVKCHPDGEYPIHVHDRDAGLVIALAPRIRNA